MGKWERSEYIKGIVTFSWIGYADSEGTKLFHSELKMTFRLDKLQTVFETALKLHQIHLRKPVSGKTATLFLGFSCAPVATRGKAEYAMISEKWAAA